jgi:hypothetical protein
LNNDNINILVYAIVVGIIGYLLIYVLPIEIFQIILLAIAALGIYGMYKLMRWAISEFFKQKKVDPKDATLYIFVFIFSIAYPFYLFVISFIEEVANFLR